MIVMVFKMVVPNKVIKVIVQAHYHNNSTSTQPIYILDHNFSQEEKLQSDPRGEAGSWYLYTPYKAKDQRPRTVTNLSWGTKLNRTSKRNSS